MYWKVGPLSVDWQHAAAEIPIPQSITQYPIAQLSYNLRPLSSRHPILHPSCCCCCCCLQLSPRSVLLEPLDLRCVSPAAAAAGGAGGGSDLASLTAAMASINQEARNDEKLAELVDKWKNIFRERGGCCAVAVLVVGRVGHGGLGAGRGGGDIWVTGACCGKGRPWWSGGRGGGTFGSLVLVVGRVGHGGLGAGEGGCSSIGIT